MDIPGWVKPALFGAVAGGIVVAIVGFTWGGWVTGGAAQQTATAAADASRSDLAAAICVQNFLASEDAREQLSELHGITSAFRQRQFVEAGGWAVMPDQDAASAQAATLCAKMLMALEPIELPVVEDGEVVEPGEIIEPVEGEEPIAVEEPVEELEAPNAMTPVTPAETTEPEAAPAT